MIDILFETEVIIKIYLDSCCFVGFRETNEWLGHASIAGEIGKTIGEKVGRVWYF